MSIPQHVLVYEFLSAGARVARVSAQEQAELRAQGMAAEHHGRLAILNPTYALVADGR